MVVHILLMVPVMVDMFVRIQEFALNNPDRLPQAAPGDVLAFPPGLMPDFGAVATPMAIVTLVMIALLFSAVVRRLHDRDRSGWWGALPLPFQMAGLAMAPAMFAQMTNMPQLDGRLFMASSLNSAFYWIAVIFLLVLLVGEGTRGPNRFGPDSRNQA